MGGGQLGAGTERGQGQLGMLMARTASGFIPIKEGLQQGGCHLPMPNVPRGPPVTLPMPLTSLGHLAAPLVGMGGHTHIPLNPTKNWMWQLLTEMNQVRLARLCRMRNCLLAGLSGQFRDTFTSVMVEL